MGTETAQGTDTQTTTGSAGQGGTSGTGTNAGGTNTSTTTTGSSGTETLLGAPDKSQQNKGAGENANQGEQSKGAPAKLELKLPQGFDAKDPLFTGFSETAQKLGLKSEQAQGIFDLYAKHQAQVAQQAAEGDKQLIQQWGAAAEKDPELGLSGAQREANLGLYRSTVTRLGGPELQELLHETGLANHPAVIRAFLRAGREVAEDTTRGGRATAPKDDDSQALYREMFPKSPELWGGTKQ